MQLLSTFGLGIIGFVTGAGCGAGGGGGSREIRGFGIWDRRRGRELRRCRDFWKLVGYRDSFRLVVVLFGVVGLGRGLSGGP